MSENSSDKRVLLVRLSAIGDIVMASGIPANIKQAIPKAKVIWLVEPGYTELVRGIDGVDEIIFWPRKTWQQYWQAKQWRKLWRAIAGFRKELRAYNFELAIDAQGLLKSAFLCRLSGAKHRLGFKSKEYSHWLLNESIEKPISCQISSEYRMLGQHLGATDYQLSLNAPQQTIITSSNYIVLCPFTTRPQKHWHNRYWHTLIAQLLRDYSGNILIVGGPADRDAAQQYCVDISRMSNLCGQCSLLESAAVIASAQLVIGVDTGMTHISVALQKPTLALFGSTRPYTTTDARNTRVLFADIPCAPCRRRPSCDERYDCMTQLTPEVVLNNAKAILCR